MQIKVKDSRDENEEEAEGDEDEKEASDAPANAGSYWNVDPSKKRRDDFSMHGRFYSKESFDLSFISKCKFFSD